MSTIQTTFRLVIRHKGLLIGLAALTMVLLSGCEEELLTPEACINGPGSGVVGSPVEFTICTGEADFMSVWTGEPEHDYSLRSDTTMKDRRGRLIDNQGYDVTGNTIFTYTYFEAGTFTVTLVARNVGDYGKLILESVAETVVTITEE